MIRFGILAVAMVITFTSQALSRDWQEIMDSGVLRVGMRSGAQIVYRPSDLSRPGMMYEMVKAFAKHHELDLKIVEVPNFKSYWVEGGEVLPKTNRVVTPDIYDTIDIAAEVFTVTSRREELVHMTPYLENSELYFGHKGVKLSTYSDMVGKTIVMFETMSFYPIVVKALEEHGIPYKIDYVMPSAGSVDLPPDFILASDKLNLLIIPAESEVDGALSYHPVAEGKVDLGINDSIAVMVRLFGNSFYKANLSPLMPAQQHKTQLAWGSRHEDEELNARIAEFIDSYKESAAFSSLLEKYIGMGHDDYQKMIGMMQ